MSVFERVKEEEGYRRYAYRDSLGVLTIGYGRNIDPERTGPGISETEASILLAHDLAEAVGDLRALFVDWDRISVVRQGALVNMRFQLGPAGFRSFAKMIAAVQAGDWSAAAREALDSRWHQQTPNRAVRVSLELRDGLAT